MNIKTCKCNEINRKHTVITGPSVATLLSPYSPILHQRAKPFLRYLRSSWALTKKETAKGCINDDKTALWALLRCGLLPFRSLPAFCCVTFSHFLVRPASRQGFLPILLALKITTRGTPRCGERHGEELFGSLVVLFTLFVPTFFYTSDDHDSKSLQSSHLLTGGHFWKLVG